MILTDRQLRQVLVNRFPNLRADDVWLEDSLYETVDLWSIRSIYGRFKKDLKKKGLTKWKPNGDCDNFALWFWTEVTKSHARGQKLAQSKAFGVMKFWLDKREAYGNIVQPHMINWMLTDTGKKQYEFVWWEPQPLLPNEFHPSEDEIKSVTRMAAW